MLLFKSLNNTCSIIGKPLQYMWKLVFNVIDVIFKFESPKGKPTKSTGIMPHPKLSKNMLLRQKNWIK
jgi:hypothetical protein